MKITRSLYLRLLPVSYVVRIVDPKLCVRCKGRLWCGLSRCPILEQRRVATQISQIPMDVSAPTPPGVFVSWTGYPRVEVAPLLSLKDPQIAEDPRKWVGMDIEDVVVIRSALLRPYLSFHVESARDPPYKLVEIQEAAMGRGPADVEAEFLKKPKLRVEFGHEVAPMGPKAPARRLDVDDVKTDRLTERVYYDEMGAEEAAKYLYEKGRDVYFISRLLSAGILGNPRRRRLVPTRWAITATDDMVYRHLRRAIASNPPVDQILLFESHLFDNHFYIIFLPDAWSFELLEAWAPGSVWYPKGEPIILNDWESWKGRKSYADNVGGSYYAARLAVLEKLRDMKRQATVVVLREVHEGYYAPLGVWQVRENVRNALRKHPQTFSTLKELFDSIRGKLRIPPEEWYKRSVLLKRWKEQRRLF